MVFPIKNYIGYNGHRCSHEYHRLLLWVAEPVSACTYTFTQDSREKGEVKMQFFYISTQESWLRIIGSVLNSNVLLKQVKLCSPVEDGRLSFFTIRMMRQCAERSSMASQLEWSSITFCSCACWIRTNIQLRCPCQSAKYNSVKKNFYRLYIPI